MSKKTDGGDSALELRGNHHGLVFMSDEGPLISFTWEQASNLHDAMSRALEDYKSNKFGPTDADLLQ